MTWIETHGIALMALGWAAALIISAAPPLPQGSGFWKTWLYNAMQVIGASADKVVSQNPKFQALTQTVVQSKPDGSSTQTDTKVVTESPKQN